MLTKMCMASNKRSSARSRKAQSALEYSICVGAVAMAIFAMVTYVKRGVSGRYADVVRATARSANSSQYEPYYQSSDYTIENKMTATQDIRNRGQRISDYASNDTVQGNGYVSGDPE